MRQKRPRNMDMVREIGAILLKETDHHKTKATGRRIRL